MTAGVFPGPAANIAAHFITIIICPTRPFPIAWRRSPRDRQRSRYMPLGWRAARSQHPGGVNVLLADGSVQFIFDGIDLTVWQALSTRNGNETGQSLPSQ